MPQKSKSALKALKFESLEPRLALAAEDLIDFTAMPAGALDGKIVYTSGGHGLEWLNSTIGFYAGREEYQSTEVNEAFGNQDQLYFYAEYLLRAGATVAPMRPIGHQINEVVLDNDSAGVTFAGAWSNSSASIYYDEDYGAVADTVSYRFSSINASETATATYTPDIPEAGFYPIYTWVADSTNRTDQLYRIHDSDGGVTEIRVDHRKVGKGWVYLGTYHFDEGTSGSVVISNQSTAGGSVVIADTIRFGNGMGDLKDGPNGVGHSSGTTSGSPREDESSLFWVWRAVGQGYSPASVVGTSNISAPHLMAEHMNGDTNPFGTSVYIGFHSNAGGGRGAVGLINSSSGAQTPNQAALALYTGRQINQDMQALNGQFEHNWSTRTSHTFTSSFGEIDGGPSAEMDMTIIEVAFHDSVEDANLLNDPKVREQIGRSTYEATIEYFANFGGLADTTSQPAAPLNVRAVTESDGDVTVAWAAGPTGVKGGTATSYRVYVSNDGYGYAGYVEVAGGGAGSYTFDAASLGDQNYYFEVVAVNSGGESPRSDVVAARSISALAPKILVVNGFDRNDRTQNERYPDPFSGDPDGLDLVDRVRPRYNNTFDYVIQYGEALAETNYNIDTVENDAIVSGLINLTDYDIVMWISGEESTADETFSATEQTLVASYLAGGGKLLVSGSEIGWDLDRPSGPTAADRTFYNSSLRADYVSDDSGTYNVQGAVGSIFAGLSFSFDNGAQFYDVNFPDRINPLNGSTTALSYVGGSGGGAGIQYDGGTTKVVNLAFPFETITTAANRTAVMDRILEFFDVTSQEPTGDFDQDGDVDGRDFLAWQRGAGVANPTLADGDANGDGLVDGLDLGIWQDQYATPGPLLAVSAFTAESEPASATLESESDFVDATSAAAWFALNAPHDNLTTNREEVFDDVLAAEEGVVSTNFVSLTAHAQPSFSLVETELSANDSSTFDVEFDLAFDELGDLFN